jgi:hypothetical protein
MKYSLLSVAGLFFSSLATLVYGNQNSLILILTTPDLTELPPGYTALKTLNATTELPTSIHSPLDNPALQKIIQQAKDLQASGLLGLNCKTNGHSIACSSLAFSHAFDTPTSNNFQQVAHELFGERFYQDPLAYPSTNQLAHIVSVTFYLTPNDYRTVSGEQLEESKAWWGLKKESITVKNPEIPALCIDSLHFLKAVSRDGEGIVNFNCFPSTSTLPGYIQVNASGDSVN